MAITSTGFAPKLLYPGLNTIWGTKFKELPKEYLDLFDKFTSTRNFEEDMGMTGYGMASLKGQGESITYDESKQTYVTRYSHAVYASGYMITQEMIEDNLYKSQAYRGARDLAYSLNQAQETVSANVYNRAFNSSYTFGDGSALCVSTHSTEAGNQSNLIATAADLSEAALESMVIQIMNAKGPRGLRIALKPVSLHIAPANVFEAERILKSVNQNDTANNAINALKSKGIFPKGAMVNHYFTDIDAFFVRTDISGDYGMKLYQRHEPRFEMDNDSDTHNAKFQAYTRFSVGNTDWRAIWASPGA